MSYEATGEGKFRDFNSSLKSSINNNNKSSSKSDDKIFGNSLSRKVKEDTRIAILNVNSFPRDKKYKDKQDMLRDMLVKSKLDVVGYVELNTYWPKLQEEDRLYEKTFDWWKDSSLITAYNQRSCKYNFQPGGCAMISNGKMLGRKTHGNRFQTIRKVGMDAV